MGHHGPVARVNEDQVSWPYLTLDPHSCRLRTPAGEAIEWTIPRLEGNVKGYSIIWPFLAGPSGTVEIRIVGWVSTAREDSSNPHNPVCCFVLDELVVGQLLEGRRVC